jgi:hypothetical protein
MAIHPPTSVQLLDAAIARECIAQNVQTSAEALGSLIGQWLLEHSESPQQDRLALLAEIQRHLQDPEAFLARLSRLEAAQAEIAREIRRTGRSKTPIPPHNPDAPARQIEREL